MADNTTSVPNELLEALIALDEQQLAAVHAFASDRLNWMRASLGDKALLLDDTDLVFSMGHAMGLKTTCQVAAVSRKYHSLICSVMPALRTMLPPRIYICGGFREDGVSLDTAECFRPADGSWECVTPMQQMRGGCSAAAHGQRLYVFGGVCDQMVLKTAEVFDPLQQSWEYIPPMRIARWDCAAASLGNKIYVCGGCGGFLDIEKCIDVLDAVDCFEPARHLWISLPPLPRPLAGCVAVSALGALYIQGGRGGGRFYSTFEVFGDLLRYHPARGQWEHVHAFLSAALPKQFRSMAIASDRRIYVLGGENAKSRSDHVACIDLASKDLLTRPWEAWQSMQALRVPRAHGAAVFVDGAIYILGGGARHDCHSAAVEMYDSSQKWLKTGVTPCHSVNVAHMLNKRSGFGAAVLWL